MYKIYINNIQIDTYNLDNIVLNVLMFDISSPDKRSTEFSNKIIVPKTATNIRVFEFHDEDLFSKTFTAHIYDDTIHIVTGNVTVIEIKENITIQIIGQLKQLTENLKKPLYELDISSADFTYSLANYNSLKAATTGYIAWEAIDSRVSNNIATLTTGSPIPHIGVIKPTYIVKNIIIKMFEDAGYSVDVTGLDTVVSDLRMISNAKDFWVAFYQVNHLATTLTAGVSLPLTTSGATVDINWSFGFAGSQDFDEIINPQIRIYNTGHFVDNTKYVFEIDIDEDAEFLVLTRPDLVTAATITERHQIKQTGIVILENIQHKDAGYYEFQFDIDVTINRIRVICLADEKEIYISGTAHAWNDGSNLNQWKRTGVAPVLAMVDGFYFKAQYNLPDWDQYDLLKEFWTMFNIKMTLIDNTVYLTHNILNDFVNISQYISERNGIKNNESYASNNHFLYNNSIMGSFKKEYDAKAEDKTIINLKSEPSIDVDRLDNILSTLISKISIYDATATINTNDSDRLSINECFFTPKANGLLGTVNITYALVFAEDLAWNELYEGYYEDYYNFLQDSRIVKYDLKLTYSVYQNILSAGKIYDNVLGRELTVLRINKYNPNKLTEVMAVTREI